MCRLLIRMDMNHVLQEMNKRLNAHMESQKPSDVTSSSHQSHKFKKRLMDLESELNTEKALHQITKGSLQTLEEDYQRLRHQFHAMRRRDNSSSDKYALLHVNFWKISLKIFIYMYYYGPQI